MNPLNVNRISQTGVGGAQVSGHWVYTALLSLFAWKWTVSLGESVHVNLKKDN